MCRDMEKEALKFHAVEKVLAYHKDNRGVGFKCYTNDEEEALVRFEFYRPDMLRFLLLPRGIAPQARYPLVLEREWPEVLFEVEENQDSILVKTEKLTISVAKNPWEFFIYDNSGRLLCKADRTDVDVTNALKVKPLGFYAPNGAPATQVVESFHLAPDEHFYGFGEKFTPLDKRGQEIVSWTVDALGTGTERSYKNIPFFMSSKGYGIFLNTTRRIVYHMGTQSLMSYTLHVSDSKLDIYLICGPSFKEILDKYTDLTGKPPIPPKWSFGLWLGGYGYRNQEEVIAVCRELRKREIPCDVINLDLFWLGADKWCDFQWDRSAFPDPKGMIEALKEMGFKVCLWEMPYVSNTSEMYREGKELGYFALRTDGSVYEIFMPFRIFPPEGPIDWTQSNNWLPTPPCGVVDFTNPAAFKWYQDKHRPLVEMGIDVFKTDMGEYAPEDALYYNGVSGEEVHNIYPLLHNKAVFEATREFSGRRAMVWSRTAYAGSQRYPISWGGDPDCNFSSMVCELRGGLSFGLSGCAFWSHDIPGTGQSKITQELYIRWAQFGLFSSHSRCHGLQPREPWHYGQKVEEVFRTYAKLRYRLIPYIYSYAHIASLTGLPILRAMVLEFQDDPNCYDKELQYCFGREFLVAPIYDETGQRAVYLPAGKWVDYWTKTEYEGPASLNYEASLEILPLFVRGDSIIPMGPEMDYVGQKLNDPLTLDTYVFDHATFTLYDDEETTTFECLRTEEGLHFSIRSRNVPSRAYVLQLNNIVSVSEVELDGRKLPQVAAESEFERSKEGWYATSGKTLVKVRTTGEVEVKVSP